ncbi:MAG: phosphoglucomutase/phosphomannomutase family protein [Clostridia bacterium]|nr:phosphoglucomutase/phosphomannomutase family protein [Clostridia bacterium]
MAREGAARAIRFGTDGWRDVIADGFTFENVRRVAAALCRVLRAQAAPSLLAVGYDTRFLSDEFAREVAETACQAGFSVRLAEGPLPTPALSFAARELGAGAGLMVTASHNPPRYNGVKLKGPFGGPVAEPFTRAVEAELAREGAALGELAAAGEDRAPGGEVAPLAIRAAYLGRVASLVEPDLVRRAGGPWVVDAMHGAGAGWLVAALRSLGVPAVEIRGRPDPTFGGVNPEPLARNLGALSEAVRSEGARGGLALDGDGDRLGVVDEVGRVVDAPHVFGLLLRHLADVRGMRGQVVKTFSVSDLVDRLARARGLPTVTCPVGFKHVAELARRGGLLLGGEESGGFGLGAHLPERDGIACALLVVEACGASGEPLSELVRALDREAGPSHYGRLDLPVAPGQAASLAARLRAAPPEEIAGRPVSAHERLDGDKFRFPGGWVLVRPSGTEPLVRVYAEADDPELLRRALEAGRTLVAGGA